MKKNKLKFLPALIATSLLMMSMTPVFADDDEPGETIQENSEAEESTEDDTGSEIRCSDASPYAVEGQWTDIDTTQKVGLFTFDVTDDVTKIELYCTETPATTCLHAPDGTVYPFENQATASGMNIIIRALPKNTKNSTYGWFAYIQNPIEKGTWAIESTVDTYCSFYEAAKAEVSSSWNYLNGSSEYNTNVIQVITNMEADQTDLTEDSVFAVSEESAKKSEDAESIEYKEEEEDSGINSSLVMIIVIIVAAAFGFFRYNQKKTKEARELKLEKERKEEKKAYAEAMRKREKKELREIVYGAEAEYTDDAYTGPTSFEPEVIVYDNEPAIRPRQSHPIARPEEKKKTITPPNTRKIVGVTRPNNPTPQKEPARKIVAPVKRVVAPKPITEPKPTRPTAKNTAKVMKPKPKPVMAASNATSEEFF